MCFFPNKNNYEHVSASAAGGGDSTDKQAQDEQDHEVAFLTETVVDRVVNGITSSLSWVCAPLFSLSLSHTIQIDGIQQAGNDWIGFIIVLVVAVLVGYVPRTWEDVTEMKRELELRNIAVDDNNNNNNPPEADADGEEEEEKREEEGGGTDRGAGAHQPSIIIHMIMFLYFFYCFIPRAVESSAKKYR